MREILFKGKRVDNGEWVYGYSFPVIINNVERWFIIPCDTLCPKNITIGELQVEVDSNTIGQYTGLTDKNGVKIFEGDNLRDDYSDDEGNVIEGSVKVIWDNENAQWSIDNSFKQDGSSLTNLVYYLGINNLEVVSNG